MIELYTRQDPYPGLEPLPVATRVCTRAISPQVPPNAHPAVAKVRGTRMMFLLL